MVLRLDPFQRLVNVSFGNRLALIYVYAGRANQFIPPQVIVTLDAPVAFTIINKEAILDSSGVGSADNPPITEQVTGAMLSAYRAWRYQSVDVYSAGHADHVGVHSAVAINLAKYDAVPSIIDVTLSVTEVAGNYTTPQIVLSTHRGVSSISLLSEGSGNAVVNGEVVRRVVSRPPTPGAVTGTINLQTLAVSLSGSGGSGSGGSGGGQG